MRCFMILAGEGGTKSLKSGVYFAITTQFRLVTFQVVCGHL